MKKAVISLDCGKFINIPADQIIFDTDRICVYNGEVCVGYFLDSKVVTAYISEQVNGKRESDK